MKKILLIATILCAGSQAALAGGVSPFYMGGSVGVTNNHTSEANVSADCTDPNFSSAGCSVDSKDKSFAVYGGLNVTNTLSVEAGYADLGTTMNSDFYYTDPINAQQTTKALTAAGVMRMPVGHSGLSVYGKAGIAGWQSKMNVTSNNSNLPAGTYKKNGVSPILGLGAEYDLNEKATVRLGMDRYFKVGENDQALDIQQGIVGNGGAASTVNTNVDVLSAGMNYQFF